MNYTHLMHKLAMNNKDDYVCFHRRFLGQGMATHSGQTINHHPNDHLPDNTMKTKLTPLMDVLAWLSSSQGEEHSIWDAFSKFRMMFCHWLPDRRY